MVKSWVIAGCWELYERREIALGICLQGLKSPSPAAHFKKEETNRPATAEAEAAVSSERVRVREGVRGRLLWRLPDRQAGREGAAEGRSEKIRGRPRPPISQVAEAAITQPLTSLAVAPWGQNRESFKMAEKRARR